MNHQKTGHIILRVFALLALLFSSAVTVSPVYGATHTVKNHNDSGTDSLRQAIANAKSGDTIVFHTSLTGATIMLTSKTLTIDKNLIIDGSALALPITISGGNNYRVISVSSGVTVTLDNLRITMGLSDQGAGIGNLGTLTVRNCTIYENYATNSGGGLSNGGSLTLINSTISDNHILGGHINRFGGGIYNYGTLTVTNSTISGNSAFLGGGIHNLSNKTMTITNSTLYGNPGGGVYNTGILNYVNTIIAGGTTDCHNEGTIGFNVHNLVVKNASSPNGCGTPHITQDPLLSALDYHGGSTKTHALLPDSPAIDAGSNDHCPLTDQRGNFRPIDGKGDGVRVCDIGAYEYGIYWTYIFMPLIVK
jgi:hypothetical protein